MKNMKWIVLFGALAFSGCQQNPFSEATGTITQQKQIDPTPTPVPPKPFPAYAIIANPITACDELKTCRIEIRTQVPTGKSILKIAAYPPGATEANLVFDEVKNLYVFTWTPGYETVVPTKGTGVVTDFPLNLRLWSSESEETIFTHLIQLKVTNTPQEWSVTTNSSKSVREGELLSQTVTVESLDYPEGPFQLFVDNAPAGITVTQNRTDPKVFTVTFRPDFTFVKESENSKGKDLSTNVVVKYRVKDPGEGLERSVESTWTINDVRKNPVISGPTALGVREKAVFSIRADDLNAEAPPNFRLKRAQPFGRVEFIETKVPRQGTSDYPSTYWALTWDDIPAEKQGQTASLMFEACVKGNVCVPHTVNIQFQFTVAPPPQIARSEWPDGVLKYPKIGETLRVNVAVEDPEQKTRPVSVQIFPESIRGDVQWMNGQLIISPRVEGLMSIELEATSVPGQKNSETFLLNVLPRNWSDVVLFSNDKEKPETEALLALMPGASVIHPTFQKSDPIPFLRRKVFVITSELLASMSSKSDWEFLEQKMKEIPNLWVATPLIGKLAQHSPYFAKLLTDRDVSLPGRLSKVLPLAPLADYHLDLGPYAGMQKPQKLVQFGGKTTAESFDPSLVEITAGTSKCTNLFRMTALRSFGDFAAVCSHHTNGKLVLMGTEFVDFTFEAEDAGLLRTWVTKLLSDGGARL